MKNSWDMDNTDRDRLVETLTYGSGRKADAIQFQMGLRVPPEQLDRLVITANIYIRLDADVCSLNILSLSAT